MVIELTIARCITNHQAGPMSFETETAERYRNYAAELRVQAEHEPDEAAQKSLLKRAGEFDQIADAFAAIEQANKNLFNALKPFLEVWRDDDKPLPPSGTDDEGALVSWRIHGHLLRF